MSEKQKVSHIVQLTETHWDMEPIIQEINRRIEVIRSMEMAVSVSLGGKPTMSSMIIWELQGLKKWIEKGGSWA